MRIKNFIFTFIAFTFLSGCGSSGSKTAKDSQTSSAGDSGNVSVSTNGYMMRAKIDGKQWTATSMLPDDKNDSRRIQGEDNDKEAIGFYIWMRGVEAGTIRKFGDGNAADLFTNDDVITWTGKKGELTITKIDSNVMEGTFSFTATSTRSSKTIEVTEGYFRFPFAKN